MNLSVRLEKIAEYITSCSMADIGTDHAFLPIYLTEKRKVQKLIATDLNDGPIAIAKQKIATAGMTDRIEVRQGSGLTCLQPGEVGDIVIAGMGGELIADILNDSLAVAKSCRQLILQPMSRSQVLRTYLMNHGFAFQAEKLVAEERHIYELMVVSWTDCQTRYSPLALQLGPLLLEKRDTLFERFLGKEINKYEKIQRTLAQQRGESTLQEELNKKIKQLREVIAW